MVVVAVVAHVTGLRRGPQVGGARTGRTHLNGAGPRQPSRPLAVVVLRHPPRRRSRPLIPPHLEEFILQVLARS